ncbi:helix-turn-helix domain-containing protein [Streptomyces sp. NPDC006368]|uniref:RICIN domain-containing protein n=1 Tax=Streptomyces sp. NPDC006368 TaxID=3156760 RepID=UPI0033A92793
MTDGERTAPDPRDARDPAGFIAQLHALKDWSGLTYRELSHRAEAVGDVLPRSTVANMLARTTVPREELLTAFVRACGAGPEALESWLTVRKELAVAARAGGGTGAGTAGDRTEEAGGAEGADGAEGPEGVHGAPVHGPGGLFGAVPPHRVADGADGADAAPAGREGTGGWGARMFVPLVGVLTLVIALTTVVAFLRGGDDGRAAKEATGPAPGPVLIRALHSGLCLNERRGQESGQVYQVPCADATVPRYALERLGGGLWRIRSDHPDFGPGCSGVPVEVPEQDGAPLVDQECGKRGPREAFRIEPFDGDGDGGGGGGDGSGDGAGGGPATGYRIRPAHADLCLRVRDASRERWTEVVQEACREDGEGQLFSFDPPGGRP